MNKKVGKILTAAAAGAVVGVAVKKLQDSRKGGEDERIAAIEEAMMNSRDYGDGKAYLVGGGLTTLAAAVYLIRDCRFSANQITVYEGMHVLRGSNDSVGTPEQGFVCRGGRILNEETYENFWELFSSIPSLRQPEHSVAEKILEFDHTHPTCAKVRLVDKDSNTLDVKSMGSNRAGRIVLLKLLATDEKKLGNLTTQDWFKETPHIFETNFQYMWQTTFAFQKYSSLFELRRYMNHMIFEFSCIETLEGVTRTPLDQCDSVIRPLEAYLRKADVNFRENYKATDIDFTDGPGITAKTLYLKRKVKSADDSGGEAGAPAETSYVTEKVQLNKSDIYIMTNACTTDSATLGSLCKPAPAPERKPIGGELWARVAGKRPGLGNPGPFFTRPEEMNWLNFTTTCKGDDILRTIGNFTGNVPDSGVLMTFRDSSWLISSVVAVQPHFVNQPADRTIFWGYGLHTETISDYVEKPMKDCAGRELLSEYLHRLHIPGDRIAGLMKTIISVIPCYIPYVDAQFEPRGVSDRPPVTPAGSINLAMVSRFVEVPEGMVLVEEYSVRAAHIAVYGLLDIKEEICPVTPYNRQSKILLEALKKSYLQWA